MNFSRTNRVTHSLCALLFSLSVNQLALANSFEKGVQTLQERVKENQENIIISPYLMETTSHIQSAANDAISLGEHDQKTGMEQFLRLGTSQGMHLISNRLYIDTALTNIGIPMTTSTDLAQKSAEVVIDQLNKTIEKDTNGLIKGFLTPDSLLSTEMDLAYKLVTWFYQNVKWQYQFEQRPSMKDYKEWNSQRNKAIDWMAVKEVDMATHQDDTCCTVQIPTKNKDIVVVLMYDKTKSIVDTPKDRVVELLKNYDKGSNNTVTLTMPKYHFDYQFTEEGGNSVGPFSVTHKAAIKVDEEGAEVAAVEDVDQCDGAGFDDGIKYITLDKPFVFAMIDRSNNSKELVGLAYVYEPWKK